MSEEDREFAKQITDSILWKLKRNEYANIPDFAEALVKLIEYLILEKEVLENKIRILEEGEEWHLKKLEEMGKFVSGLIGTSGTLCERIINIESKMIDFERFYLAKRIISCRDCRGIVVFDWEPPIIMKELHNDTAKLCEKHQKELDEFNRKYASD